MTNGSITYGNIVSAKISRDTPDLLSVLRAHLEEYGFLKDFKEDPGTATALALLCESKNVITKLQHAARREPGSLRAEYGEQPDFQEMAKQLRAGIEVIASDGPLNDIEFLKLVIV